MKQIIGLALPLAACSPAPAGEAAAPTTEAASPYAFEVNLTLTPRAAEKLVEVKERVMVASMYFGAPVSETAPGVDDHMMEVGLGGDDVEVDPVNALVKVPGTGFDAANMKSVTGEPEVLINVFSARKTQQDNLLKCDLYQGPVSMAQKQPVEIKCDLIYDENGVPT